MYDLKLQVWLLQDNGAAKSEEPDMEVPVSKVLPARVCQVHVVSNGLAFLCSKECHQFAVELKKMCLKVEFECLTPGYPLHMPWPPALLVETSSNAANDVVNVETQNILAIEDLKMGAYPVDASVPELSTIDAPHMHDVEREKLKRMPVEMEKMN